MGYPRLLILAEFPPEGGLGGGVIVRNMLQDYPADRLLWYPMGSSFGQMGKCWRPEVPRKAGTFYIRGRRFKLVESFWRHFGYKLEAEIVGRSAARAAAEFGAEVVWAILDYHILFKVERFIAKCPLPLHVSIHDDPIIKSKFNNYRIPIAKINEVFSKCLLKAQSHDAISKRLADHYQEKFQVDSFVLTRGVELKEPSEAKDGEALSNPIKIVLGGNIYCPPPWPKDLIAALLLLRHGKNIPVEFYVFASNFADAHDFIYPHGVVTEPEYDSLLRTMHIGYAVNPLTEEGRELAASSFPTKVVTYIGAGLPFLYHGPQDSTVGDLLKTYHAGVIVESHDPEEIAAGFLQIVQNYQAMRRECRRAARECFDSIMLRQRLLEALCRLAPSKGRVR